MRRWLVVLTLAGCSSSATDPDPPGNQNPPPVAAVNVALAADVIEVGETTNASVELRDASGNLLSGRDVAWSSDDEEVATVSGSGVVTGVGPGETTIAAMSEGRSATVDITVVTTPTPWTVGPAGVWHTEASVRGEDSFAILTAFCDLASDGRLLWGFNLRQLGEIPFTGGIEFSLIPEQPGDTQWPFNASSSHGGVLTLPVDVEGVPGTAGGMVALLRERDEAVLIYPTGNPVESVTVRFDLRDGARAIAEAEESCLADD